MIETRPGLMRVHVKLGRTKRRATVYCDVIGTVAKGDRVVVNTTAVDLGLGTGGDDFVVWNLETERSKKVSGGHIMKMRYTPWQIDTMVAEAPESSHHDLLSVASSLDGMPVVACGLHSQLAAVTAMIKHVDPDLRIAYLMSDGGALPIQHSDLVHELKDKALVDATITYGHAFGGDYESVNLFSGLVTASEVAGADIAVVAMGPGMVGTESLLGHTGMEQGQILSAAAALGGRPIAALRISFADERERHRSVSHHTLSALRFAALARSTLAIPDLEIEKLSMVMEDLISSGLSEMHDLRIVDSWETRAALEHFDLAPTTMGRSVEEDADFFEAAGAAGLLAGQMIYETAEA